MPKTRGMHEPDNYVNLYDLVTHRQTRSAQDILHRTHLAAFYLYCLKKTNYFTAEDCDTNRGPTDDELFIGHLLLHHLMLLQFNAFEVSELRQLGNDQQTVFIGGSVYPTLALLNHSCDPCVVRYSCSTITVINVLLYNSQSVINCSSIGTTEEQPLWYTVFVSYVQEKRLQKITVQCLCSTQRMNDNRPLKLGRYS